MAGARGLTIGEAAARLAAQFPGVTVAVLRRLEAGGRFTPGRAASGYRRYSAADLERLTAILTAEYAAAAAVPGARSGGRVASGPGAAGPRRAAGGEPVVAQQAPAPRLAVVRSAPADTGAGCDLAEPLPPPRAGTERPRTERPRTEQPKTERSEPERSEPERLRAARAVNGDAAPQEGSGEAPASGAFALRRGERRWPDPGFFAPDLGEVSMDRDRLASAARTDREWIDGLVEYGLLADAPVAEGADLLVARASAELAQFGVEPRHLRAVAASAERVAELVAVVASGRREPRTGELRVDGLRAGGQGPGGAADMAAATVRLHAALVRAALLRG